MVSGCASRGDEGVCDNHNVAIIGAGVVGTSLGYLLRKGGWRIVGVASRTMRSARKAVEYIGEGTASLRSAEVARRADVVLITTSDGAIEETCRRIAADRGFRPGAVVLHTCGALPSLILKSARANGASIGSLHPLQSLASVGEAIKRLPGSYFCIEGDKRAVGVARQIVALLDGREITIRTRKKAIYHAGASVASNFLVATVAFGRDLLQAAGVPAEESLKALMPLVRGTVENIEALGIPDALTGPISRGDTDIVERHLRALSHVAQEKTSLYTELGRYTVSVARQKGTLNDRAASEILSLLDRYRKGTGKKDEGPRR